jgi:2-methylisocitrate lyase-like PEP mutase family enzyme
MFAKPRMAPSLPDLLARGLVRAPGVADALAARIAEQSGFSALYISGGAVARSLGYPDVGLVTLTEMAERIGQIRAVTTLPLIADADTGYGGPLSVARTVDLFERAGASALHLEDQADPKRCAGYGNLRLVTTADMVAKVRAAVAARRASSFLVVARTDAIGATSVADAVARVRAYRNAGADLVFVESVRSEADIAAVAEAAFCPLLLNAADLALAGIPLARAQELGCRIAIFPADLQKAAIRGMQRAAQSLFEGNGSRDTGDLLATDTEREGVVGLASAAAFEAAARSSG